MEELSSNSQKCTSKIDSYSELMKELSKFYAAEFLFDTLIVTKDGVIWAHSLMLSAVSPFVRTLLNSVGDYNEDIYVINLPDVEKYELEILLHLLYTGFTLINRNELENIKTLTGLLKMIKIPVSMVKQNWKSRTKIGHRDSSLSRNTSSQSENPAKEETLTRENTDTNVNYPMSNRFSKSTLNTSVNNSKTKENEPVISQNSTIENSSSDRKTSIPFYDLSVSHLPLLQNDISTNNHLSRTTSIINDLATKDFNPLFEENSNFSDFGGEGCEAEKNNTENSNINMFIEQGKQIDSDPATLQYQNEEISTIKEIQVYVSDNGEVTALEVLQNEDSTSHKNLHSPKKCKKSSTDNNQIFTSSGQIENFNKTNEASSHLISSKEQNNEVATSVGIDVNVQQISTSDAPYVLSRVEGSEGVIGLISVTEAFENSQKTDFNDVASSTAIVGSETETLIRQCVLCPKSLLGLHAYGRHMKTAHPKLFGPYECPWPNCERTQEDGAKMLTHITQQHSKSGGSLGFEISDQIQDRKGTKDENQCLMCNISLSSSDYLTKHNSRFHGITKGNVNITSASDNLNDGERNVYFCSASDVACQQKFMTSRSYIAHMKQVHKEKPWLCDECDRRFQFKQSYQQHAMLHGHKKSYICDLCSKSYATPRLLYSHRSLHLGRRFPCNMCNFVGRSSANIRGHKINVHGERRLACKVCGKRFAITTNLQDHMRIHTGETPFTCEICDMSYKRKHHLTCHIRSKAHMSMILNCHKLGIKVPPELDPDEPKGDHGISSSGVGADEANIMLPDLENNVMMEGGGGVSGENSNFETHISEIEADHQVLIFEPCEEIEPYIIEETEEVIVMDVN